MDSVKLNIVDRSNPSTTSAWYAILQKSSGTNGGHVISSQQHGSVYWRCGSNEMLAGLNPGKFLHDQLASFFSLLDSPIWMDSSTTDECQALEDAVGGPLALADITGSRAYERFTGNQASRVLESCC